MPKYEVDLCQIDKEWLEGRLQESVIDTETGDIIGIFSGNRDNALEVAKALNKHDAMMEMIINLRKINSFPAKEIAPLYRKVDLFLKEENS